MSPQTVLSYRRHLTDSEKGGGGLIVLPVRATALLHDLLVCSTFFFTISGYNWLRKGLIAAGIQKFHTDKSTHAYLQMHNSTGTQRS